LLVFYKREKEKMKVLNIFYFFKEKSIFVRFCLVALVIFFLFSFVVVVVVVLLW